MQIQSQHPRRLNSLVPQEAMFLFGTCFFLFYGIGGLMSCVSFLAPVSILLSQVFFLALPVVLFCRWRRLPLGPTLRLYRLGGRQALGTLLLALGTIALAAVYMQLQERLFKPSERYIEFWASALASRSLSEFAWKLFAVALVPAVCEEMLFRGLLTNALRPRVGHVRLVLVVGLLFAFFHADTYRLVPVFGIGVVLTWVALAAGTLYAPILFHAIFNGATVTYAYSTLNPGAGHGTPLIDQARALFDSTSGPFELGAWGVGGLILFALGVWLLRRRGKGTAWHGSADNAAQTGTSNTVSRESTTT